MLLFLQCFYVFRIYFLSTNTLHLSNSSSKTHLQKKEKHDIYNLKYYIRNVQNQNKKLSQWNAT